MKYYFSQKSNKTDVKYYHVLDHIKSRNLSIKWAFNAALQKIFLFPDHDGYAK